MIKTNDWQYVVKSWLRLCLVVIIDVPVNIKLAGQQGYSVQGRKAPLANPRIET